MGNPNVGKSAIFSRLTGARVIISNYPGTTVEFTQGYINIENEKVSIVDVPGTYDLDAISKAEEVAVNMLEKGNLIINIVDATKLERNLYLTLELLEKGVPVIMALNMWDDTKHQGIEIDTGKLEEILKIPVVPTCGLTSEGVKELLNRLPEAKPHKRKPVTSEERWKEIGRIIEKVQKLHHRHHTFLERLEDISIKPLTGIPIAGGILYLMFKIVRLLGEGLINYVFDPLFNNFYSPFIAKWVTPPAGFFHDLLLGTTPQIMESFGLLTTAIYVPIVVVLPYVFSFYFVLSFLEDLGYLPRLAVMMDNLLHKIGLHGYASIPVVLGLGCKVPSIFATRILENRREKIIALTLTLMIAPCMPQTAMIISLIGKYGGGYLAIVFGTLVIVALAVAFILNKIMKGEAPPIIIEIPPYRLPKPGTLFKKLWMRIRGFLLEAIPLIILGILVINILDMLGAIKILANLLGAPMKHVLGLPKETISVVILGFLRKDISIALLQPFGLTIKQLIVASVFLVLYLPCLATFSILIKEVGLKDSLKITGLTFIAALLVSGILNLII